MLLFVDALAHYVRYHYDEGAEEDGVVGVMVRLKDEAFAREWSVLGYLLRYLVLDEARRGEARAHT